MTDLKDAASWIDPRDIAKVVYALKPSSLPETREVPVVRLPPPFKAGPIPASEYRKGAWRDASSFAIWRKPPAPPMDYPFKRQRVP